MKLCFSGKWTLGVLCILSIITPKTFSVEGVVPSDWAVQVTADVSSTPPQINLKWPGDIYAKYFNLFRKAKDERSWKQITTLPGSATSYADTSVQAGLGYEYKVEKLSSGGQETWTYTGYGYIYAGSELPVVDFRGKVILLVESGIESQIQPELAQLQADLVGDGWVVIRDRVSANDAVATVRDKLRALYYQDPGNTKAVFLIGHIPVAYSGDITPDEHPPDHQGAWPADTYYGDLDGVWTDNSVTSVGSEWPENHNVPGDGKFDQSEIPSGIELQVGRVDMSNLTCFANKVPSLGELDLLRRYFAKDHAFRMGQLPVQNRAILYDAFYTTHIDPEPIAAFAWRNYAALVGGKVDTVPMGGYFPVVSKEWYLWSSADIGGGGFTIAYYNHWPDLPSTSDVFATQNVNVVFSTIVGSFFGDWDNESNFLRASLGAQGGVLTASYAGKPQWLFHHMALGETIGYAEKITQENNASGPYLPHVPGTGQVHISLLGDPTLRAEPLRPAGNLTGSRTGTALALTWESPSLAGVRGYYVYTSPNAGGPFVRQGTGLVTGNSVTLTDVSAAHTYYMVKPVVLSQTPSGSYYNTGLGVVYEDPGVPQYTGPEADAQTVSIMEGQATRIRLSAKGTGQLNYLIATQPAKGSLSGVPPDVLYTPKPNATGVDSFLFVVNDGVTQSMPAQVTLQLEHVNHPPIAKDLALVVNAGQSLPISAEASDPDGDTLWYEIATGPTKGVLSGIFPALTYSATAGATGVDVITYRATDPAGASATGTVTFSIVAANTPPQATALNVSTKENLPVSVHLVGVDPEGDPVTYMIVQSPGFGSLTGTAPDLQYVPNRGYFGSDSFRYAVRDSANQSATADVVILVERINEAPSARDLLIDDSSGTSISITLAGTDPNGDPLTYRIVKAPAQGQLLGSGQSLQYVPASGAAGVDTFTYVASDGFLDSAVATVTVNLPRINHAPVAPNQTLTTTPGVGVSIKLAGTDQDGDLLSFQLLSAPQGGQLSGAIPDLVYVPYDGYQGTDSFRFAASDGHVQSTAGTIQIVVTPIIQRRLVGISTSAGGVRLTLQGVPGGTFGILCSPDAATWNELGTGRADSGGLGEFVDETKQEHRRFYRVVWP